MRALLIGATGATGKDLLDLLLQDESFQEVEVFVRRDPGMQHQKLKVHLIDFDEPEQWRELVKGDVLFSCLGTTLKAAGSKAAQWKIDYEYQYRFAKVAQENNVKHYVLVSSANASPNSFFYYPKLKGKLEEAVKALGFPRISIFKPPLLVRKNSDRLAESIGIKVINFFNRIGMLRNQLPLPTEVLAQAMLNVAKAKGNGKISLQGEAIRQCAQQN